MNLTSAFSNKRDISQLKLEELEDLEFHLQNREKNLKVKMEQLRRDLADIATDRDKVKTELSKR